MDSNFSNEPTKSSSWQWLLAGCCIVFFIAAILLALFGAGFYYWLVKLPSQNSSLNQTSDTSTKNFADWSYQSYEIGQDKFSADFPAEPTVENYENEYSTANLYTADDPQDQTSTYSVSIQQYKYNLQDEQKDAMEAINSMVTDQPGSTLTATEALNYPPYECQQFQIKINDRLSTKGIVVIDQNTVYKAMVSYTYDNLDNEKYDHFITYFMINE